MLPLALHIGLNREVLRTSGRLQGTSSGPSQDVILPSGLALTRQQKESPSSVLTVRWLKCFLEVRNKGRKGFVQLGHFDKHFVKNTRIKSSRGKHFGIFSPKYS